MNLQQISEEFQNAIANNVFELPLNQLMNAIYGAAKTMKKTMNARCRSTENVRQNKAWFDTKCENLRKKAIRALRNFHIVQTAQELESYKRDKCEYKEIIKMKNPNMHWNVVICSQKQHRTKP